MLVPASHAVRCLISGENALAIEEPAYAASFQEGGFEVRDYPAHIVAEVSVEGDRDTAARAGFRLLAGYIFRGNSQRHSISMSASTKPRPVRGESIAMTAPVTQLESESGWLVRFTMPRGYSMVSLPVPNDPLVRLVKLAPARVAVVRFSGRAGIGGVAQKTAALREFVAAHEWEVCGTPVLARYNPPWTLWFLRRNEVMLPLVAVETVPDKPVARTRR